MMRVLLIVNLVLLLAFPIAWAAPLARAGLLPWFGMEEMTVLTAIGALLEADAFLALLVIFFAIVAPMVKTLALASVHLGWTGPQVLPTLEILGKLAMADVFLIALYIVAAKGVGVGADRDGLGALSVYLLHPRLHGHHASDENAAQGEDPNMIVVGFPVAAMVLASAPTLLPILPALVPLLYLGNF